MLHSLDPAAHHVDEHARYEAFGLLETAWPGIREAARLAATLGAAWEDLSIPFFVRHEGTPVAHAGLLRLPLVVAGERLLAGGIHGVCTHPLFRGRGLCRAVMEEALAFADEHCDLTFLYTVERGLYERFGYRRVPLHAFELRRAIPRAAGRRPRRLRADEPQDLELLHRLLADREVVSREFGVLDPGRLLIVNEVLQHRTLRRLYFAEDLDAVLVLERRGTKLRLLDVVAERLPTLEELLTHLPRDEGPVERVEAWFTPDRFERRAWRRRPEIANEGFYVRGNWPASDRPIAIPPHARC